MRKLLLATLLGFLPSGAIADELIGSYIALLSDRDHYNSSGQRLTEYWQVIRQDRANFHRFNKVDEFDQWDPVFGSTANRARAEQMIKNGTVTPGLDDRIVREEVMIKVDIMGRNGQVKYLKIKVH